MADLDTQAEPEHAPAGFELEQSDYYSQYLLHSRSEIVSVLRSLIQRGAMITVYFDQGRSFLLTSMIALAGDNHEIILDLGSNEEMNSRALLADKLIFTTNIDKVKIQFSLPKLSLTRHEGRQAFTGSLPETLLRLQRREYFRLSTPLANPIKLGTTVQREDGSAVFLELPLLDISGGGVGLTATLAQAQLLHSGDSLKDCKMMLPHEGLLVATLGVRNKFDVTTRSGFHHVRIGCEFLNLPALRVTMVQRYITHAERERKARLSGLS